MTKQPVFDSRRAASIIHQHLIETLHGVQDRILRVERFGKDAVTFPQLGRKGVDKLPELLARHGELVVQINALRAALDADSEAGLRAFVDQLVRERGKS